MVRFLSFLPVLLLFSSTNKFMLSFFSSLKSSYMCSSSNHNRAAWLVDVYKIKIIRRDKKMALDDVGGGGASLPNIIPSKSPSPPGDPAPP